ncbi:hypothetical protein HBI06_216930 [Parastagonospora nodorum]|nr:hypothetical protein HBI06_216930 [Parastagonospora nodorum]KAH4228941.1 hypothetical protein HBI05_199930 [Parastagonospora nodorum]KAH6450397.1 hypothetical protein HBI57_183290 [Parastagonospora nodorum]KAH6504243.1 hypothetical protein HBI58_027000 [Parastagonospora nodorum]
MASPLAANNAFGAGSPHWNLPFPAGNITAAELMAYLPHWLKSIDVIDRFVTNGGKSVSIAALINEFRNLPGDGVFRPNSATVMMSYGMRRAKFHDWTVATHFKFKRPDPKMLEKDLNVEDFRVPRETHPKSAPSGVASTNFKQNREADPIEFQSLARHVKTHPAGDDALDLARCVAYALSHPAEKWYFPTDFEAMVNKLGGPAPVTNAHHDRQIFARRTGYVFPSPQRIASRATPTIKSEHTQLDEYPGSPSVMSQSSRFTGGSYAPASGSPLKRMMGTDGTVEPGGRRKSGRLAKKATVNFRDHGSDFEDNDDVASPPSDYSTPAKRRRLAGLPPVRASPLNDSDFHQGDSESDEEIPDVEVVSEDELVSPIKGARGRAAALKAREVIRDITSETQRNIDVLAKQKVNTTISPNKPSMYSAPVTRPEVEVSPEMMDLARAFPFGKPVFLKPPVLSENRLRVDSSSIYLYAADGAITSQDMWASALSSTRFNGPRRHAPFRELHRLTDPMPMDVSDWAENIRWAKEQYALYGSDTWTEYDYHLQLITEHRRAVFWVSDQLISFG